jgi:probable phosphoglycerate mutase
MVTQRAGLLYFEGNTLMSRIVMVRHGETVWHAENRYAGRRDIALTSNGLEQAERLARWALTEGDITSVWSSTLSRARDTAFPAARALDLPLQVDERLVELDFGQGEGLTSVEMLQKMPAAFTAFRADPVRNFLPEGEDPVAAVERAMIALGAIAKSAGEPGRSLVVAHSTLLRLVLCKMLEIPLSHYRTVFPSFNNCSLTEVRLAPDGTASLLMFNVPLSDNA